MPPLPPLTPPLTPHQSHSLPPPSPLTPPLVPPHRLACGVLQRPQGIAIRHQILRPVLDRPHCEIERERDEEWMGSGLLVMGVRDVGDAWRCVSGEVGWLTAQLLTNPHSPPSQFTTVSLTHHSHSPFPVISPQMTPSSPPVTKHPRSCTEVTHSTAPRWPFRSLVTDSTPALFS